MWVSVCVCVGAQVIVSLTARDYHIRRYATILRNVMGTMGHRRSIVHSEYNGTCL